MDLAATVIFQYSVIERYFLILRVLARLLLRRQYPSSEKDISKAALGWRPEAASIFPDPPFVF